MEPTLLPGTSADLAPHPAAKLVAGPVGAAVGMGRREGRPAHEKARKEHDAIGDIETPIVVGVGRVPAGGLGAALKEMEEGHDGIRQVELSIGGGIAAA